MFGSLKDKLRKSVAKLAEKAKPAEKPENQPRKEKKPAEGKVKGKKPRSMAKRPAGKPKPETGKAKAGRMPKSGPEKKDAAKVREVIEQPEPVITSEQEVKEEVVEEPATQPGKKPEQAIMEIPAEKPEEPLAEKAEERAEPAAEKRGFLSRIREKVVEKELSESDISSFFDESEVELMQSNVAVEAIDYMRKSMISQLAGKKIKRRGAESYISEALENSLLGLVDHGSVDLEKVIADSKSQGKPVCIVFLGFNGAGKTTSIAKVASYLKKKGYSVVLAAGDTFRAASIEQLEHHGSKLGVRVIKHDYGADSAAVIFDARKHAESRGIDVVLADTAGRMHTDKNLADELKKVVRVNSPELKVLLVDSLTGNDAVEQAKQFNDMVGVDCVIMAKTDVNEKGGSILSVSYAIKKPILFLGTGQGYQDIKVFKPEEFVRELMG